MVNPVSSQVSKEFRNNITFILVSLELSRLLLVRRRLFTRSMLVLVAHVLEFSTVVWSSLNLFLRLDLLLDGFPILDLKSLQSV